MAFTKLFISGNVIETYQYEKQPFNREEYKGLSLERFVESNRRKGTKKDHVELAQDVGRRQDNARRAQVAFGRLCSANFTGSEIPVFCTFTFATGRNIQDGYKLFGLFIKRMRTECGVNFRYVAVPEFGRKGSERLHFHALFWGLELERVRRERKERYFAKIWQYGFIDMVVTNGDVKVGYYLAKYLNKAYKDKRLFGRNSYVCSRNILRPLVYSSFIDNILDYCYNITVDNSPSVCRSYDTLYLGRCDYKLYNI